MGSTSADPTCTVNWTGSAKDSLWTSANNWSTKAVPGSEDRACIASGVTVKVTSGSSQVGSLSVLGTLVVSGGSLEVVSASTASSVAALTVSGGTLSGVGSLTVTGTLSWTAGSMAGSGSTVLASGATGTINPGNSNQVILESRSLVNSGTLTWSTGSIALRESAEFSNGGTFNANAQYPTSPNWTSSGITGDSSSVWIHNTGTFQKASGTGTSTVQVPFDNQGAVSGKSGQLGFYDGGKPEVAAAGSWAATGTASVAFAGGSFLLGSAVSLTGTIDFTAGSVQAHDVQGTSTTVVLSGGSLELTSASTASNVSALTLASGGTLTGAGTLNVSTTFSWTGGTMSGSGSTALGSASTATVNPGNYNEVTLDQRTLANHGTLTWSTGSIWLGESAELDNGGTFNANAQYPTSPNWTSSGIEIADGSSPWIHNTGAFQKASGTGTSSVQVPFDDEGSVIGKSGQLGFYDGGRPEVAATGSWSATGTASVAFAGGAFQLGSGVSMAGTVDLTGASVQAGDLQGSTSAALALSSGSLEVTSTSTASNLYALTQSGGTLSGAATVNLAHSLTWTAGTMSGTGETALSSGATGTLNPGNYNYLTLSQRFLSNQGTLTWSTGTLYIQEDAELSNGGTFNANAQYPTSPYWTSAGIIADSSGAWIHNTGTFQKAANSNTTTIQAPFDNQGSVSGQKGQLAFYDGSEPERTGTGSWSASTGASVAFAGGSFQLGSGVAMAGTIDFTAGSVQAADIQATSATLALTGGSLALTSATTPSNVPVLNLQSSSSTLSGTATVNINSTLSWTAGTMSGVGVTSLASGATGTINPGNSNYVFLEERTLANHGTLTWSTGSIYMREAAEVDNVGTFTANSQDPSKSWTSTGIENNGGTPPQIHNTGTFQKSSGTGTTVVSVPFDNQGSVLVKAGQLAFYGGGYPRHIAAGSWTASSGASLAFDSGHYMLSSAATLSGTVHYEGGTVTRPAAPTGSLDALPYASGEVSVVGNGTDEGSGVANATIQVSPAGESDWQTLCGPLTAEESGGFGCLWNTKSGAYTDGSYQLRARIGDYSEPPLTSTTEPITVLVDNTPPTGTLTVPTSMVGEATLSGTASDGSSGVSSWQPQIVAAGGAEWTDACPAQTMPLGGSLYSCSIDSTAQANGEYQLRAVVTDGAGNTYTTSTHSTTIDNSEPEEAPESDCTDTWTGEGADGSWQTAANWSTASVPGTSDVVCVPSGASVEISAGTQVVSSLKVKGALVISGGSLELTDAATVSNVRSLTLSNATLDGAGTVYVYRSFSLAGGATLSGSGKTVIGASVSGHIEASSGCEAMTLAGRTLLNEGTLTFGWGTLVLSAGAQIENKGTFRENTEAGCLGSQIQSSGAEEAPVSIVNTGAFLKTAGAGSSEVAVPFDNQGVVEAQIGTLRFNDGGVSGHVAEGSWVAGGSSAIVLSGGTFVVGVAVNLADISVEGATVIQLQAPSSTSPPSISGEAVTTQTLTASSGSWSGTAPVSYGYQWQRCSASGTECSDIAAASSQSYTLVTGDVGATVRVVVTAVNSEGSATAASTPSTVVTAAEPPSNTSAPVILGTTRDRQTLTASTGVWSGIAPISYSYQWQSCDSLGDSCIDILGATGSSYVLGDADLGTTLRVLLTATDSAGATSASSDPSALVGADDAAGLNYAAQIGSEGSGDGQLAYPGDVAIDPDQNVWVLDSGNDRVEEFNHAGEYIQQFGSEGSGDGQLDAPAALALDSKGDIWVADSGNRRIVEFDKSGAFVRVAGAGEVGLDEGIAVDRADDVWVSDTSDGQLVVFNGTGERLKTVGSPGSEAGQLGDPEGLSVDSHGHVWVADWSNNRIEEFDEHGEYLQEFGAEGTGDGEFRQPDGVTVDSSGDIWVAEVGNDRVQELAENGAYISQFGSDGVGAEHLSLSYPVGLAVDAEAAIWVSDAGDDRVTRWVRGTPFAPANQVPPSISGPVEALATLTAEQGVWSGSHPLSYTYQWQTCDVAGEACSDIEGATEQSLQISEDAVGRTVRVLVQASNDAGSLSASSAPTAAVSPPAPPVNTEPPVVSGTADAGHVVEVTAGTWAGTPTISYTYAWERCDALGASCEAIAAAEGSSYELVDADGGSTVRAIVTATNPVGSASTSSEATARVGAPPANIEPPMITGDATDGQTLAATAGSWSSYPGSPAYTYQWQSCHGTGGICEDLPEATAATYAPNEDAGANLRVLVTATNAVGATTSPSDITPVVAPSVVSDITPPVISGTAQEGQMLNVEVGAWSGSRPRFYAYQWESCSTIGEGCMVIAGATSARYLVKPTDVGGALRVMVTATNAVSSAVSESSATASVAVGPYYVSQFGVAGSAAGQLNNPGAVVTDAAGDLWVLDSGNDRVEEFGDTGVYLASFGSAGAGSGELSEPRGLAIDATGDILVADTGNNRVEQFSAAGVDLGSIGELGSGPGKLRSPGGIAVDSHGHVWVSDTGNGRIEEFAADGTYLRTAGASESGAGEVRRPEGLAVDSDDDIWVADAFSATVKEFSETGEYIGRVESEGPGASELRDPDGVAVDAADDVWVGDISENRVLEFDEHGEYRNGIGSFGSGEGQLELEAPMGVTVDSAGDIRVVDSKDDRVEQWKMPAVAPSDTVPPTISGATVAGETLSAAAGSWSGVPLRYDYQWQTCDAGGEACVDIAGAERATFTPPASDAGVRLRVRVTASNASGSTAADSLAASALAAASAPTNTTPPVISGGAQDGQTLSASSGAWSGDPTATYTYQWRRCDSSGAGCAPIEAATSADYQLEDGDIATTLRVTVTATNIAGSAESTSAASASVAKEPASEIDPPTISGTPDVHQVLYADPGLWTGTARQFGYQWETCSASATECVPIEGATEPEYDLGEGNLGSTIRVRIGAQSSLGALTDVSAATAVVDPAGTLAATTEPTISGTPQVGATLSAGSGQWYGTASVGATYQWQACDPFGRECEAIVDATAASYTPVVGEVGRALRVQVTSTDEMTSVSATSAATEPVAAAAASAAEQRPVVTGTALAGSTLTVSSGAWSGTGSISYAYQWERCSATAACVAIGGATAGAYTPTASDLSASLGVLVTATRAGVTATAATAMTAAIEPEALTRFAIPSIAGAVEPESTLAAEPGIWSGLGPVSYTYQWERCDAGGSECDPISGAGEPFYTESSADLGSSLRIKVSATNPLGSQTVYSADTVAIPGGAVSAETARGVAQETDPALLAASTTATLEGGAVTPALEDGEQINATQTLTSSNISKETLGEFAVNTPDGEIGLTPVEASPQATAPTIVNGTVAMFANSAPATDTILRPDALGATAVLQLRSAEAPKSFSWEVQLGADQQLRQLPDGRIAVTGSPEPSGEAPVPEDAESHETGEGEPESSAEAAHSEAEEAEAETEVPIEPAPPALTATTAVSEAHAGQLQPQDTQVQYEAATAAMSSGEAEFGDAALLVIDAPEARDAEGHSVPSSLSVIGNTITLTLQPASGVAFPVIAAVRVAAPSDKTSVERDPFQYGLSDEKPETFSNEHVLALKAATAPLHIQTARLFIPYDTLSTSVEAKEKTERNYTEHQRLDAWLAAIKASSAQLQPYVIFTKSRYHGKPSVSEYRAGIKKLIGQYDGQVRLWGSWNEPNLPSDVLANHPERAGDLWQVAESVVVRARCHCTVVAGEFFRYDQPADKAYVSRYESAVLEYCKECWLGDHRTWRLHRLPSVWGLHDYQDIVNFETGSKDLKEFEKFARGRLGKPRIWIGEAGVQLHNGAKKQPPTRLAPANEALAYERQKGAAEEFLHLHDAKASGEHISRVDRVYYYSYEAPSEAAVKVEENEFDSGLFEAPSGSEGHSYGEARTAYCVLAYATHRCPLKVESVELGAKLNPHGIGTEVKMEWGRIGGGYTSTTSAQEIGPGVTHPVMLRGFGVGNCEEFHYRAVAKNGFETADGEDVLVPVFCV